MEKKRGQVREESMGAISESSFPKGDIERVSTYQAKREGIVRKQELIKKNTLILFPHASIC